MEMQLRESTHREKRQLAPVYWKEYVDEEKSHRTMLGGTPTLRCQAEEEKPKKTLR